MKKILIFMTILNITAINAQTLKEKWDAALDANFGTERGPITVGKEELTQSFCFVSKDGSVAGENIDKKVSIASVSKLFTSAWSLDTLGEDYQYNTKIFVKDGVAHIEGSFDPVFGSAKIFWLISELKKIDVNVIKELSFHENFVFFPNVASDPEYEVRFTDDEGVLHSKYFSPTAKETTNNLIKYLNTKQWSAHVKAEYELQAKAHQFIEQKLNLTVDSIVQSNENPFVINGQYEAGTTIITLKSVELKKIIKFMNAHSNNIIADIAFVGNGGKSAFDHYIETKFGKLMLDSVSFQSGSGLPYEKSKAGVILSRVKNQSSCKSVLNILARLQQLQNNKVDEVFEGIDVPLNDEKNKIASDFMPVSGSEGTVKGKADRVFVGKTGSLKDTSALAGSLSTARGIRHFAILTQFKPGSSYEYENSQKNKVKIKAVTGAKAVQSLMIKAFMAEFGENKLTYSAPLWIYRSNRDTFDGAESEDLVVEQN